MCQDDNKNWKICKMAAVAEQQQTTTDEVSMYDNETDDFYQEITYMHLNFGRFSKRGLTEIILLKR